MVDDMWYFWRWLVSPFCLKFQSFSSQQRTLSYAVLWTTHIGKSTINSYLCIIIWLKYTLNFQSSTSAFVDIWLKTWLKTKMKAFKKSCSCRKKDKQTIFKTRIDCFAINSLYFSLSFFHHCSLPIAASISSRINFSWITK